MAYEQWIEDIWLIIDDTVKSGNWDQMSKEQQIEYIVNYCKEHSREVML